MVFVANKPGNSLAMGFNATTRSMKIYDLGSVKIRFKGGLGMWARISDTVDISASRAFEAAKGRAAHSGLIGPRLFFLSFPANQPSQLIKRAPYWAGPIAASAAP